METPGARLRRTTLAPIKRANMHRRLMPQNESAAVSSMERHFVWAVRLAELACVLWIVVNGTIGLVNNGGTVCPRDTVCAEEWYTVMLLTISRVSAYHMYPALVLVWASKSNNLRTFLQVGLQEGGVGMHARGTVRILIICGNN